MCPQASCDAAQDTNRYRGADHFRWAARLSNVRDCEVTATKDLDPPGFIQIDMEEFLPWIGVPFGGPQMKVHFVEQDFQRWVTHTDNYNPLHFDQGWSAESRFGQIVAPQSFTAIRTAGEAVFEISKTPMGGFHAGDEFFFYGPRIYAGDKMRIDRVLSAVRATETRYGPSAFVTVDHLYMTQRGPIVRKRSASMLYPTANALAIGSDKIAAEARTSPEPTWTDAQIEELMEEKVAYIRSWRTHEKRFFGSVKAGDKLPRALFGPHTGTSFLYGETCCAEDVLGLTHWPADQPAGLPRRSLWFGDVCRGTPEAMRLMPPVRGRGCISEGRGGHIHDKVAIRRGMPRAFGFGSVYSIWSIDHLSNWAGEWGSVRHSTIRFTNPILSGDVSYIDVEVTGLSGGPTGYGTVHVSYTISNQDGLQQCSGLGAIELPLE